MSYSSRVLLKVSTGLLAVYLSYRLWFRKRTASEEGSTFEVSEDEAPSPPLEAPTTSDIGHDSVTDVCVYYASQTGTAERLARNLATLLSKWEPIFKPEAINLEDWKTEDFLREGAIAIFLVSTHDDGLFPDNALSFVKWIKKIIKEGMKLDHLRYCIFGLGSNEYPLFNQSSKNLQVFLKKLGAHELMTIALGDESVDLNRDFYLWKVSLLKTFQSYLNLAPLPLETDKAKLSIVPNDTWRNRAPLELRYIDNKHEKQDFEPRVFNVICKQQWNCSDYLVVENIRMTPEGDAQTNCVVLQPKGEFAAAETANVLYANPPEVVDYFIGKLKLKESDLEKIITFVPRYGKKGQDGFFDAPFPVPCTIKDALVYYLDLTTLPSTEVLSDMGTFLRTSQDCERYNKLLDSEALLKRMRDELSVILPEFVEIFMQGAVFNLGGFLQIVPKKIPKAYTISSHPKTEQIALTVKLVQFSTHSLKSFKKTIDRALNYQDPRVNAEIFRKRRFYKGACTHFLCSLKPGDTVKIYRRASTFSSSASLEGKPTVMIANGAGIAPFRALWQNADKQVKHALFFGCRDTDHLLYKQEMEELETRDNFTIHIAFSRMGNRIYVQELLKKHIDTIRQVLNDSGVICICGSKQMGAQVRAILQHYLGVDITEMKEREQYVEELW